MDVDFSKYKLVIAPMLYMVREGVGKRIEKFVKNGGTFVTTYWSGIADENDLCFLTGFPGPLRKTMGVWSEEIDALYDEDVNYVNVNTKLLPGMQERYEARIFCDLIHAETARPLAVYDTDFYAGRPALTVNEYGAGKAYYIAFRNNNEFLYDFYGSIISSLNLNKCLETDLPMGVTAQMRTDGERDYIFLQNYSDDTKTIFLNNMELKDLLTGNNAGEKIDMSAYSFKLLVRECK